MVEGVRKWGTGRREAFFLYPTGPSDYIMLARFHSVPYACHGSQESDRRGTEKEIRRGCEDRSFAWRASLEKLRPQAPSVHVSTLLAQRSDATYIFKLPSSSAKRMLAIAATVRRAATAVFCVVRTSKAHAKRPGSTAQPA